MAHGLRDEDCVYTKMCDNYYFPAFAASASVSVRVCGCEGGKALWRKKKNKEYDFFLEIRSK